MSMFIATWSGSDPAEGGRCESEVGSLLERKIPGCLVQCKLWGAGPELGLVRT